MKVVLRLSGILKRFICIFCPFLIFICNSLIDAIIFIFIQEVCGFVFRTSVQYFFIVIKIKLIFSPGGGASGLPVKQKKLFCSTLI